MEGQELPWTISVVCRLDVKFSLKDFLAFLSFLKVYDHKLFGIIQCSEPSYFPVLILQWQFPGWFYKIKFPGVDYSVK